MLDCAIATPFGRPLDPDVYITYAIESSGLSPSSLPAGLGRLVGACASASALVSISNTGRSTSAGRRPEDVSSRSTSASSAM